MGHDEFEVECAAMSNETLVTEEVSHRRSIASYVTSLSLTTVVTVGTCGVTAPLMVPIGGFKAYKIHSHHKKLKSVRAELAKRQLSTAEKKKRDVLIPATVTMTVYIATLGLADVFDIVPDSIQNAFQAPIAESMGTDSYGVSAIADKYQVSIQSTGTATPKNK
ncbi:hypothetical protein FRC18_009780 [Serendipita sp. 400]|nr:hypothetical protein FRC18_009780 [Serendipita sp. 400]